MGILANLRNTVGSYVFPWGEFNATPGTLNDGDQGPLQVDANGNLKVAEQFAPSFEDNSLGVAKIAYAPIASGTYSPTLTANFSTATAGNLKATAGNVFSVVVTNANAAVRYLQLHNKASTPVNPDVPVLSIPIPAGTAAVPSILTLGAETFSMSGVNLATGVSWGISTTLATYTAATNADHVIHVFWK
jgi:hypothetical protein